MAADVHDLLRTGQFRCRTTPIDATDERRRKPRRLGIDNRPCRALLWDELAGAAPQIRPIAADVSGQAHHPHTAIEPQGVCLVQGVPVGGISVHQVKASWFASLCGFLDTKVRAQPLGCALVRV
eukprot:2025059-Prymnesium_polylepis.2